MNEKKKRLFLGVAAMLLIVAVLIPSNVPRLASPARLIFPAGLLIALILIKKFYGGTSKS
jgi:hypothetical protein